MGLALLSQAVVNTPSWLSYHQGPATHQQPQHQFTGGSNYGLFCWIYGLSEILLLTCFVEYYLLPFDQL